MTANPSTQSIAEVAHDLVAAPHLLSLSTATPPEKWDQDEVRERFAQYFPQYGEPAVQRIFRNAGIDTRHFAIGRADFDPSADADELHAVYREHAVALGTRTARQCLDHSPCDAADIDFLIVSTCTGYMCPGLSAYLARELGLRTDIQRADLVGMGCSGAMPTLQRATDFVRAYPDRKALLVTVEISSACWFVDNTMETVVGNAICGDGAAAAIIGAGSEFANFPSIGNFHGLMDTSFIESVGFEFKAGKNRIILAKELRDASGPLVKKAVEQLLERHGLDRADIARWVIHSGGKRVLDSIDEAMGFAHNELANSRAVLREFGNVSAPTLLFVLQRALDQAKPGEVGVLVALGPGLSAETALVNFFPTP